MVRDTASMILEKNWGTFKNMIVESAFKGYTGKQVSNYQKEVLKILLENTKKTMITEGLTTSAQASVAVPVILGLTKKFFPKLIANEIVSVQPLTRPTGIVKFKKMFFEGSELASHEGDGLLGSELSRGIGEFEQVSEVINVTVQGAETKSVKLTKVVPPFKAIQKGSVKVTLGDGTVVEEIDGTLKFQGLEIKVQHATGNLVVSNPTDSAITTTFTISYNTVGFETNSPDNVARVYFDFENIAVNAITRKLKASWTYEFLEDIQAELGDMFNFEQEAFEDVSALIAQEINREIITDLWVNAYHSEEWTFDPTVFTGEKWLTAEAYFRTLIHKLNTLAGKITRSTKRFEPNFIVVSPYTKQLIVNGLTQYEWKPADNAQDAIDYAKVGFVMSGTISGKWNVYVTPSIPDEKILIGYKGTGVADSGYVYAPYIPLKAVPITYESIPGLYLYTRYGKAMYAPWFYGVLNINGLR